MQRLTQKQPGQRWHDQERQAHEWVGQVQRRVAKDPDPAERGEAIQGQRGDQPAVGQQCGKRHRIWYCLCSLFEQKLPQADGRYAQQRQTNE